MKKRLIFPAVLVLSLAMISAGISVYAKAGTSVFNTVSTGAVRISISPSGTHFENILPGQRLEIRPEILNEGYDCYLRASYETDLPGEFLTMQNIPEEWVKNEADGFWYYKEIVRNGESVPVFDGVCVDPQLPWELSKEKTVRLLIRAEAVQSANFTPDFTKDDPWNGTQAETAVDNEIRTDDQGVVGKKGLTVTYEGKADELIADPQDFFTNLPELMPGDTFTQTIHLKNQSEERRNLYFFTETKEGNELLEKISLQIRADGELLYYGTLDSPELSGEKNRLLLCALVGNKEGDCTFSVSVPASLKNKFSLQNSSFEWTFQTDDPKISKETPAPKNSKGTPAPGISEKSSGSLSVKKQSINTGDTAGIGFYLILFGAAIFVTAVTVKYEKKKRKGSAA